MQKIIIATLVLVALAEAAIFYTILSNQHQQLEESRVWLNQIDERIEAAAAANRRLQVQCIELLYPND